jgi:hypothetical protein
MKRPKPAPGKSCGACTQCCVELVIDTPEFKKDAHVPCAHLTAQGCGIYQTRFKICRAFLCGWMLSSELGEDWRPDRSGVLMMQVPQNDLPERYRLAGHGVLLLITGGEAAITRPGFAEHVLELVSRGVGVYLTAISPKALVNEYLEPMVAAKDAPGAGRTLLHLYRLLAATRTRKAVLALLPHFYRLQLEKWRTAANNRNK